MQKLLMSLILILASSACHSSEAESKPIPIGTYQAEGEKITVSSLKIYLHIKFTKVKSLEGQYIDREYNYTVDKNGLINLSMSSNDFAIIEFNSYDWHWKDGSITKVDTENGKVTLFRMQ
jgi:major membrane immunogen (membrane-anchored lipoprotein)